jgi:protein-disulfide isomerase
MFKALNIRNITFAFALLLPLCLTACKKESAQTGEEPRTGGHVLSGSASSPVRIEVFSNLQCGACRTLFLDVIQPVMREYQDKVSVVYYEFPLNMQYDRPAARYVSAAARLGQQRLLSVYDVVFNEQSYWALDGSLEKSVSKALSSEDFLRIQQILRDSSQLAEINENIEKDQQRGRRKGVNATPTMFVSHGGKEQKVELGGRLTLQVMKQYLDPIVK